MTEQSVAVGRVGKAHGLRGEVSVAVMTDVPEIRFAEGATLAVEPSPQRVAQDPDAAANVPNRVTVGPTRWHSGRLLVTFAEVPDRTAAEAMRGALLIAAIGDEVPAEPDEYFDHQLRGLRAVLGSGEEVGVVADVLHLPGQDLLAVDAPGREQALIPFVHEFVPEVRLADGVVVVDPPEGLLS